MHYVDYEGKQMRQANELSKLLPLVATKGDLTVEL